MTDHTEEHDDSDNVLAFTKRFDSNADIRDMRNFVREPKPANLPRHCGHIGILVDDHYRTLTCRRCGAVVDAFDWISKVTDGEDKVDWELKSLRQEIKDHREGLEKLKREEVNCRARIKTAQFKLNDTNMEISKRTDELTFLTGRIEQVKLIKGKPAK